MGSATDLYPCPSCGAEFSFKNKTNNLAACTCGKVWKRVGDILLPIQLPLIKNSPDVIQPGTTGTWNDVPFSVTGRFRLWFRDTVYNYWTIDLGDGAIRYLAESYGMFAVYEPMMLGPDVSSRDFKSFERSTTIVLADKQKYEITEKNATTNLDLEGAVYKPDSEKKVKSIEAVSATGRVELLEFGENLVEVYHVHPVSIETLRLENLRIPESKGKEFSCRECSTKTVVKTYPLAQSWVCNTCETRYSVMDAHLSREHGKNKGPKPMIHLHHGSTLVFHDISYTVIGFAHKRDKSSKTDTWKEYTLYNPERGYVFVTESEGHWMLLKETDDLLLPSTGQTNKFYFEDKLFERFLTYNYLTLYAIGEFPGNIFEDNGAVEAIDFISPPEVLSIEKNPGVGVTWFRGEYIDPAIIKNQIDEILPTKSGIAPAQPKIRADTLTIIKSGIIGIILMLTAQYVTGFYNAEKKILTSSYVFADTATTQTFVTERFKLEKWKSNLELQITAPVSNSWFELNATLVNVDDGTEYNLQQGVEYYHGYTDGESWSEGGSKETAYFSSIPRGNYFMQLTGVRDNVIYNRVSLFDITIINDTQMYRNFWLLLLAAIAWPFGLGLLNYYNEKQRWANSPYSEFTHND